MKRFVIVLAALICAAGLAHTQIFEEYAYGPDRKHRMDVYAPSDAVDAPVILMLHGGSWTTGNKRWPNVWLSKARHYRAKGYIFVSTNTRLLPEADPIEQTQDFGKALAYVQANAQSWGGDPDRIVLMGHSSGAHVASLLATRQDLQAETGVKPVLGVISLDTAAIDVAKGMAGAPKRFLGPIFGDRPELWAAASPSNYIDPRDPPMLVVCSTQRRWPCEFANDLAEFAAQVSVLPVDLKHREINAKLGQDSAYTHAVDAWLAKRGLP